MATGTMEKEAALESYLEDDQKDKAVALLCEMALESARSQNFERAEQLRDRLYEVDNLALTAIVQVNEAIENEKSKTLTPDRRRLWQRFFDDLSTEEVNAFFTSMKSLEVEPDRTILRQGAPNDTLYLINQGRLKIIHTNENKEQLIHQLEAGDIFGEETFFSVNVCTVSVVALSRVRLSCFKREQLDKLKAAHPFLENNLQKICLTGQTLYDRLRRRGIDRRAFKRINLQARLWVQVLTPDARNALLRPVQAELWDISKNGLSFYLQSKNRDAVRRLIGRTLGIRIELEAGLKRQGISVTGIVQGVQNHPLEEYSIHLKLNREFSHSALQTLRRLAALQS